MDSEVKREKRGQTQTSLRSC